MDAVPSEVSAVPTDTDGRFFPANERVFETKLDR